MTYHIRVGKVDDDHIILFRLDCCNQLLTYFLCTHLRLQIISSNLWRFHKNTILTYIRLLYAAVEEECYVCILLCLGDTCLFLAVRCKELTKCILDLFFLQMQPVLFGIVTSYSVKHTYVVLILSPLSNPSNASSQNVLVISLARSGRKLKKITESFSLIVATGAPFFVIHSRYERTHPLHLS